MMSLPHAFRLLFGSVRDFLIAIFVASILLFLRWARRTVNGIDQPKSRTTRKRRTTPPPQNLVSWIVTALRKWFTDRFHSQKITPIRWLSPGGSLKLGRYRLTDPLVYTSESTPHIAEPSCIDQSLPIGSPSTEVRGSLGLSPAYSRITPDQRANYLEWLNTGRCAPLDDVNYAFLYLSGLERRLLIDRQDFVPIVEEAVRLVATYRLSGSFDGHITRFLTYGIAREGPQNLPEATCAAVFACPRIDRDLDLLAVGLTRFVGDNRPLPATWALRIARLDPRSPRSVVVDRNPIEFAKLFNKRYQDKFGIGLILKTAKREQTIRYEPANRSLTAAKGVHVLEPIKIANTLGLSGQFAPLITIWTETIEALKPLSRVRASQGEVLDRASYQALPDDLKVGLEHPDKSRWEALLATKAADAGVVLIQIRKLAELHQIDPRKKLTATQGEALAATAEAIGLTIEPDARTGHRLYGWYDLVALYPRDTTAPIVPRDPTYTAAAFMLELGVYIAAADGSIDVDEIAHIAQALESQYFLNPEETRRLEALRNVLIQQPRGLVGLGPKLVAALTEAERRSLGAYLVGVAASNGPIPATEFSALRAGFKTLKLERTVLDELMAQGSSIDEPISVSPAGTLASAPVLALDEERLRKIVNETREVSRRLAEVMDEAEPEDEADAAPPAPETAPTKKTIDPRFTGLDPRYHSVLAEVMTKPEWSRPDFDTLVRCAALMPSATLDIVNEWAMDTFGDPILEENDDRLVVHLQLISK